MSSMGTVHRRKVWGLSLLVHGSGSSDSSQSALHSIVVVFVWILFLESEILPLHLSHLSRKKFSESVNLHSSVCFSRLSWELVQSSLSES